MKLMIFLFVFFYSSLTLGCDNPSWLDVVKSSWILSGKIKSIEPVKIESENFDYHRVVLDDIEYFKGGYLGLEFEVLVRNDDYQKIKTVKNDDKVVLFLDGGYYETPFYLSGINCPAMHFTFSEENNIKDLIENENRILIGETNYHIIRELAPEIRFDLIVQAVIALSDPDKVLSSKAYLLSLSQDEILFLGHYLRRVDGVAIPSKPPTKEYIKDSCYGSNVSEFVTCALRHKLSVFPAPARRWGAPTMGHEDIVKGWEIAIWYYIEELKSKNTAIYDAPSESRQ